MQRNKDRLNLRAALTFIFTSRRWPLKLLSASLCLLFFWLLVPGLLFAGYLVATARAIRSGERELPSWRPLRRTLLDGTRFTVVLAIWTLPITALSLLTSSGRQYPPPTPLPDYSQTPYFFTAFNAPSAINLAWLFLLAPLYPAIFSQYLARGVAGAFNLAQVLRRVRTHGWLTLLLIGLSLMSALSMMVGLAAAGIGLLIVAPYACLIQAHLFGQYARFTDAPAAPGGKRVSRARLWTSIRHVGQQFTLRALLVLSIAMPAMAPFTSVRSAAAAGTAPASDPVIPFDDLAGGTLVNTQYPGISFNNPTVRDYSNMPGFAHSGTKAIEQCYLQEFCTTPISMTFPQQPVTSVSVWVGYSAGLSQDRTVELLAWDSSDSVAAFAVATLRASQYPQPIQIPLQASSRSTNIVRAQVSFNQATIPTNFLAVDDVEFDLPDFPSCSATGSPLSGPAPLAVQFQASASGGTAPYTYEWTFGDGPSTGSGPAVSHTYQRPGAYTATLTVQDATSKRCLQTLTLQATSAGDRTPPIVHIFIPTAGQTLTTQAIGTFHLAGEVVEDGVLDSLQLKVTHLDYQSSVVTSSLIWANPTSTNPNYTFDDGAACCLALGGNQVTVRATDGAGNVDEASLIVTRQEPTLDITIDSVEVTQAISYAHTPGQVCLDENSFFYDRPCTMTAGDYPVHDYELPLIQGKDTVVRVYPKVTGTPNNDALTNLGAILSIRQGNTVVETLQPMSTLGSSDRITAVPGSSLTDMRGDLRRSWNFLIPAADTNLAQLTLDIEVNPVGSSGYQDECLTVECLNNNHLRLLVYFHQPKTLRIREVMINVMDRDGHVISVTPDEVTRMERYIQQTFPMHVEFGRGGSHTYTLNEIDHLSNGLGITGDFVTSERCDGLCTTIALIVGAFSLGTLAQYTTPIVSTIYCYLGPEPSNSYTLGLSPTGDFAANGLGFPPVHYYIGIPMIDWFFDDARINVLNLSCRDAWANVRDPDSGYFSWSSGDKIAGTTATVPATWAPDGSSPDGAAIPAQEISHTFEVGPGHYSCNHNEQDLWRGLTGIFMASLRFTPYVVAILTQQWWLMAATFDVPIRCEPDDGHGSIREFGLDMTGNRTANGEWRVVNPTLPQIFPETSSPGGAGEHVHDYMSYGYDDWVSPLTYVREFDATLYQYLL